MLESSPALHRVYAFLFSPEGGGWGYPFLGLPGIDAFLVSAGVIAVAIAMVHVAVRYISTRETLALVVLIVVACGAQLALRSLAPHSLGAVVEHRGANGFLEVARAYSPAQLLSAFHEIAATLPMHARANLPGKTLLFHALLGVASSTQVLGVLIVLLSTCGGALVYFLAREWSGSRAVAVYAFAFYVFMPARSYFMPVMNVMTPVFLLVPLCLLEVYLRTRRTWLLAAAGAASYWLILFEPLPLIAAPIALAQVVRRVRARHIAKTDAVRALLYPVLIVAAIHLAMRLLVGFDTVAAFLTAWEDARRFNAANERPYGLWAFHNVKDALLHAGVGQAALFLIGLALLPRRRSGFDGVAWLIATLAFVFVMLAVLGINRGETVRLWIFLGVLLQIAAASICASRPRLGDAVLALAVVQVGLLLPAVGWVMLD